MADANYSEDAMLPLFGDTVLSFYNLSNELNDLAKEKEIEEVKKEIKVHCYNIKS